MNGRSRGAAALLAILAAVAVYGFFHEHLLAHPPWAPEGRARFLLYTAVYWAAAGLIVWMAPRWLAAAAGGLVLIYALIYSAPLAVLYLFGSCFLLGRILFRRADAPASILLGLATWMFAIWMALHFPVNTRAVYAVALAIPYVWEARRLREHMRGFRVLCDSRGEAAGAAVLLYILIAHFLLVLKPEGSADGLSMHLALPMAVAHDARWAFDFHHYTWALMPAGGDCLFTAAYLLGGAAAARLANFALLVLIVAMVVQTSRRWLTPGRALLAAALFASTPLAALVTGSLFVENVWAAMVVGGSLAVVRYVEKKDPVELSIAGLLSGAGVAAKLIAVAFAMPAAAIAVWAALRRRHFQPVAAAAVLMVTVGAPPYLYSLMKTGNPVFPFANAVFRSPYFNSDRSFADPRFVAPLSWRTAYDATFRSSVYFEGGAGSAGFQYFVLLLPAVLVLRKKAQWLLLAMAAAPALVLFALLPNLRYIYPALPLFSMLAACLLAELPAAAGGFVLLTALNAWFLAAPGVHPEFALFTSEQRERYVQRAWPERALIEHLNRTAPGEPVAFFSCGSVAGLEAIAYTDSWHSSEYSDRLSRSSSAAEIAAILRELGIRHIIAPITMQSASPLFETFLRQWAGPTEVTSGRLSLFGVRDTPVMAARELPALPPGAWDDLDARIEYTGAWIHDPQFREALNGSITYSYVTGDSIGLSFTGSGITWVFTKALNRGVAAVVMDGVERARIDLYSRETAWRSTQTFGGLAPGKHSLELRVTGQKNPASSGTYVDLDGVVVIP